ncbi:helix-turn-helix domain-containing protein [Carnobacterium maltaromaticum]|uniref:Helix-turn-helix domain-containing protein n=1 Tax=Carnobacterium maltaromaticum TaxID=2751 RepID=A0AAW9JSN0_CARML|nr:helix-turn-helix domain-containing protein [Carnobacterium maltaromaticum]MDZ5759532.1 helix-turn-helix domain-containing protein [Carnobacterium maltaromaticum]
MLEFLDIEYIKMVKILDFINKSVKPVSLDEIAKHIKTVKKTANTLLVLIKNELKDFDFEIRVDGNKKYYLKNKYETLKKADYVNLDAFVLACGKRSIVFSMVEELYHKGYINVTKFCADKYVSSATFSRAKKQLTHTLNKSNLSLATHLKGGIIGDEYYIRVFYFQFFNTFYNSIEWPFEQNQKIEMERFYQKKIVKITNELNFSQKSKLYYLISIIRKRLLQNNTLLENIYSFNEFTNYNEIYKIYESYMSDHGVLSEKHVSNETNFFMYMIYLEQIFSISAEPLGNFILFSHDNNDYLKINKIWIEEFKSSFKQKISLKDELQIYQDLYIINQSYDLSLNRMSTFFKYEDNLNSVVLNQEIYQQTKDFYYKLLENKEFSDFVKNHGSISIKENVVIEKYYHYIYTYLFNKKEIEPIKIFMSNTFDRLSGKFIKKKLLLLFGGNIEIQNKLNGQTNLIITNSSMEQNYSEELLISSHKDTISLNKIVYIIQEKIHAQINNYELNEIGGSKVENRG